MMIRSAPSTADHVKGELDLEQFEGVLRNELKLFVTRQVIQQLKCLHAFLCVPCSKSCMQNPSVLGPY